MRGSQVALSVRPYTLLTVLIVALGDLKSPGRKIRFEFYAKTLFSLGGLQVPYILPPAPRAISGPAPLGRSRKFEGGIRLLLLPSSQIWSSLPFFFLEFSSFFLHFRCCWLMATAKLVCEGVSDSLGLLKVFLCFLNKGLFPRFGLSDEFCLSLLPLPLPLEVLHLFYQDREVFDLFFMSSSKMPFFPLLEKISGENSRFPVFFLRIRKVILRGCFFGNVDLV